MAVLKDNASKHNSKKKQEYAGYDNFKQTYYYMTFGQMKKTFRLIQINGNINPEFSL